MGKLCCEHIPWTIMVMKTILNVALHNQGHQSSVPYFIWHCIFLLASLFVSFLETHRHFIGIY